MDGVGTRKKDMKSGITPNPNGQQGRVRTMRSGQQEVIEKLTELWITADQSGPSSHPMATSTRHSNTTTKFLGRYEAQYLHQYTRYWNVARFHPQH